MKYYNITVNGVAYSVSVEETAAGAAPVAAAVVSGAAAGLEPPHAVRPNAMVQASNNASFFFIIKTLLSFLLT